MLSSNELCNAPLTVHKAAGKRAIIKCDLPRANHGTFCAKTYSGEGGRLSADWTITYKWRKGVSEITLPAPQTAKP